MGNCLSGESFDPLEVIEEEFKDNKNEVQLFQQQDPASSFSGQSESARNSLEWAFTEEEFKRSSSPPRADPKLPNAGIIPERRVTVLVSKNVNQRLNLPMSDPFVQATTPGNAVFQVFDDKWAPVANTRLDLPFTNAGTNDESVIWETLEEKEAEVNMKIFACNSPTCKQKRETEKHLRPDRGLNSVDNAKKGFPVADDKKSMKHSKKK